MTPCEPLLSAVYSDAKQGQDRRILGVVSLWIPLSQAEECMTVQGDSEHLERLLTSAPCVFYRMPDPGVLRSQLVRIEQGFELRDGVFQSSRNCHNEIR